MIRPSRQEDLEQIMDIWLSSNVSVHHYVDPMFWKSNYDGVKEAIAEGVTVFEQEGRIAGFIGVIEGYVAGLFVEKELRNLCIGKALIEHEKRCNKQLTLHVFEKNEDAIRFYEREGFQKVEKTYNEECREMEYRMEWIG